MKVSIIDYGMGNIHSIRNALEYLGAETEYTSDPEKILDSDRIVLPGVGSYNHAMQTIVTRKLDEVIRMAVNAKKIPILGICLGMQLLGMSGTEDGYIGGLGLFNGKVEKFKLDSYALKVPHIGFNEVEAPLNSILYKGISDIHDFYFVHSYRMITEEKTGVGYCVYGEKFVASFEADNIFGTQFHPEKSQTNGLRLLKNFLVQ
ncbi:MAG: imidazole glycerol phosphate synthase subunit HisH [Clostridiales bacterium]